MGAEIVIPVEKDSTSNLRQRLLRARDVVQSNQDEIAEIEAELICREGGMNLREVLAELCHDQWSGWMRYLFGLCVKTDDGSVLIPSELYTRWYRQMTTPYAELSQREQDSDRREAQKFEDVFERWLRIDRIDPGVPDLLEACEALVDFAIWMSGSSSFSPGGEAHEGWMNLRGALDKGEAAIAKAKRGLVNVEIETEIELDTAQIADLFEREFEGWCPVCKDQQINEGEVICCECFKAALEYHINTCGCYP